MTKTIYKPNEENLISIDGGIEKFQYCDKDGKPIFITKEINKQEKRFVFYPYTIDINNGSVKSKRIKKLEFIGWDNIEDIPDDFKTTNKYGIKKMRARYFFNFLYYKFKDVSYFTIGVNLNSSFKENHITLNWSELKVVLRELGSEKNKYDRERNFLLNKELAKINPAVIVSKRYLPAGDLSNFLNKYDSFDKLNTNDLTSISAVIDLIPPTLISTTSNFINSQENINRVYLEDIIKRFEKLLTSNKDNEKQWQDFFEKYAWILSHLFPYEVILTEREAYVGGKTIGNDEGRVVDFLFLNGFQDNYALLEVKTHKKDLLKKGAYRKPATFATSEDLSGGIAQCLDQKDIFIKDFGNKNPSFNPKSILIIGRKDILDESQRKCFELIRANQKSVEIVTFDEILMKLKGLLKVLTYND